MTWTKESFDLACEPLGGFNFILSDEKGAKLGYIIYVYPLGFYLYLDSTEILAREKDLDKILIWLNENEACEI